MPARIELISLGYAHDSRLPGHVAHQADLHKTAIQKAKDDTDQYPIIFAGDSEEIRAAQEAAGQRMFHEAVALERILGEHGLPAEFPEVREAIRK